MTLSSLTSPGVSWSVLSGSNGSYSFSGIPAGLYTVSVPVFTDLINGSPSLGFFIDGSGNVYTPGGGGIPDSDFGTPVSGGKVDSIADINLQSGFAALDYDFSELGVQTDMVSKRLFLASTVDTTTYWEDAGPAPAPATAEPGTLVLLLAGAGCGGLVWQRRRARRRRLARDQSSSGITVGCACASPWWRRLFGRRPRPANIGPVAELLTKSFPKVHNLFKFSFKERVMKVVRILSIALALAVTAMVSQSRADMIYSLQAINGDVIGLDSGNDLNADGSPVAYTITGSDSRVRLADRPSRRRRHRGYEHLRRCPRHQRLVRHTGIPPTATDHQHTATPTAIPITSAHVGNYNPSRFYHPHRQLQDRHQDQLPQPVLGESRPSTPYLTVGLNSAAMSIL